MPHKVASAGAQVQAMGQRDDRKERRQVSWVEVFGREFWFGSSINLPMQGKQAVLGTLCWRPALGRDSPPGPSPEASEGYRGTRVSG